MSAMKVRREKRARKDPRGVVEVIADKHDRSAHLQSDQPPPAPPRSRYQAVKSFLLLSPSFFVVLTLLFSLPPLVPSL